jgi:hypothetical protein
MVVGHSNLPPVVLPFHLSLLGQEQMKVLYSGMTGSIHCKQQMQSHQSRAINFALTPYYVQKVPRRLAAAS